MKGVCVVALWLQDPGVGISISEQVDPVFKGASLAPYDIVAKSRGPAGLLLVFLYEK